MSIPVTSKFKPINNGKFPVAEDVDIEGGYQVRDDTIDLNSIPSENRKEGMLVFVKSEGKYYSLQSDLVTWSLADFSKSIPKKRRFNNSPQSHAGSTFNNFIKDINGIEFPLNKTLQTRLGSKVNQILYDPTEYTFQNIDEFFTSSVPETLGFDLSDKIGPFIWFNRLGNKDFCKYDSSTGALKVLPMEDCLIPDAKIKDIVLDPINQAIYGIGDFYGVIKIDAKDNQIDKIIFLPDQNSELDPVTILLAKKVLFDPVNEKVIVIPKWQSNISSPWVWTIDKNDNVTKYSSIFGAIGGAVVIGGTVIDGFLYMLTYNLDIDNCNLYKVDISTMTLSNTYLFDVSAGGYSPPTFVFPPNYDPGEIENPTKIVKNPNYPLVYILSQKTGPNPSDTGYIYRLNLNTGVTTPLCLNAYGISNPLDITFDVSEDCIFVTDRGVSDNPPSILKITDDGTTMTVVDALPIFTNPETLPNKSIPIYIEYCQDEGTLISDCGNDKILKISLGFTEVTQYLSLIGNSRWSVPNVKNNKYVDGTESSAYSLSQEDQIIYVWNALFEGDFNTFVITLPVNPIKGTTVTIKDISNIPASYVTSLGKALIEITTNSPSTLIEPSPGDYAGNSCYIVRPMISLTLNFDGEYWRIISFYTKSNGITFETAPPPINW